jgi:hypothetical protein
MALPTINPFLTFGGVQSVIGYLQWQAFFVQFTATNGPILSWTCGPIAPGLFFDTDTGRIDGAAIMPGICSFYVTATNAEGESAPQLFTMAIQPASPSQPSNIIDLTIDAITRKVTLATAAAGAPASAALAALFTRKAGDDVLMNVGFMKNGVRFVPPLTGLKFAIKEFEPERELLSSDTWSAIGADDEISYLLYVKLDSAALRAALSNYEGDAATRFLALCEFEWTETNETDPLIGPETLVSSTETWGIDIPRDMIPNAA